MSQSKESNRGFMKVQAFVGSKVLSHAKPSLLAVSCLVASMIGSAALAQSPIPGSEYQIPQGASAPLPGSTDGTRIPAHVPSGAVIANPAAQQQSFYKQLPLTAEEARIKIEEMSNRLAVSRPSEVKDNIFNLCEWLQECADAHWKMYLSFDKLPGTKPQAKQEKETAIKFSRLKNRARLLKADVFIKEGRYPEALGPLVEIVTSEPTTDLGQAAYKRLTDMGFSDQISSLELAQKEVKEVKGIPLTAPKAAPPAQGAAPAAAKPASAAPAKAAPTTGATAPPAAPAATGTAGTKGTAPAAATPQSPVTSKQAVAAEPAETNPVVAKPRQPSPLL
jgi:hypothetical protein